MTDIEPTEALRDVLTDLRRHLEWQREWGGDRLLADRAVLTAARVAKVAAPAPTPAQPASSAPAPVRPLSPAPVSAPPPRVVQPPPSQPVVPVAADAPVRTLDEVRRELGDCSRCGLCQSRRNLVFGVGNPRAQLVFVGEAPGLEEDTQGVPFVGEAGQLLTKMIEAMGFHRDEVYLCNVVKCRPPEGRKPEREEVAACEPFLRAQLTAIGPKVIVALGAFATQTMLRGTTKISEVRGTWQSYLGIPLMPTFHPAYLLKKPAEKPASWSDLQQVMKVFGKVPKKSKG